MNRRARVLLGVLAVFSLMAACTTPVAGPSPSPDVSQSPAVSHTAVTGPGPDAAFVDATVEAAVVNDGDDWSLPPWVRPAANSGFFSEDASPSARVDVRSVDVSWGQIQPTKGGPIDRASTGKAQGLSFASLDEQLADGGPFWMRIFASGQTWAPAWVAKDCGVATYGPDYDGQRHLPIWDDCVWGHLMDTYRAVFADGGLASDPRLQFVYVPGGFTWAEFDYEMITAAVDAGDLDLATYKAWYDHAWTDLVGLFGEHATKLVFTGEDYPFGPFGADDDLLAKQAVDAGTGIRTGITELSNFHLSEAPAYGSRIQPDGHLVVDESLPVHDGRHVVATENECYVDCGYSTDDPYYAVRQSNLKALQLRMNWIYVVPGPSFMTEYADHWDWVRLSMGQTASTSADAWADLRDAEDTYWKDDTGRFTSPADWATKPWVRNLERWLVQVDEPGSVAHRSDVDVHREVFEPDNGTAYEGLSTKVSASDTGLAFDVDPRFVVAAGDSPITLKITFYDEGSGSFTVDTTAGPSVSVARTGTKTWRTATVRLPDGALGSGETAGRLRISLSDGADDLTVRFVRVVRTDAR